MSLTPAQRLSALSLSLRRRLSLLQSFLSFSRCTSSAFATSRSVGRPGVLGLCVGCLLGCSLSCSLLLPLLLGFSSRLLPLSLYLLFLSLFHALEFLTTAVYNPSVATSASFVVDHSPAYTAALLSALLEYVLRLLLSPLLPCLRPGLGALSLLGLLLCLGGQATRAAAMSTCGENFNHIIQTGDTRQNHALVTHGIYALLRHPSYTGWFYWSVGTQLLLGNPVNAALYAGAAWRFFGARIPYEEDTLVELFGDEYVEYMGRSWVLIPFIGKGEKGRVGGGEKKEK